MGILVEKFWLFSNATHTSSVLHRTDDVIPIALLLQLSELGVEEKEEDKQEESVSWYGFFSNYLVSSFK